MTCDELRDDGWCERYAAGVLTEEEQARVEGHFFACDDCFAEIQTLLAIRDEVAKQGRGGVPRPAARPWSGWLPMAAIFVVALSAALALWLVRRPPSTEVARIDASPAPGQSAATASPTDKPVAPARPEPPAPAISPAVPATTPAGPSLAALARFTAPAFVAVTIRGTGASADPLTDARTAYGRGQFQQAAELLAQIESQSGGSAEVSFFLGVSALKAGRADEGLAALARAAASGEVPFAIEAHYYAARGQLAKGDVAAAREALGRYIGLDGDQVHTARALLKQLESVPQS